MLLYYSHYIVNDEVCFSNEEYLKGGQNLSEKITTHSSLV